MARQHGIPQRGKDYNHSTYCDGVVTGLCGLVPRADEAVEVDPAPAGGGVGLVLPGRRAVPRAGRSRSGGDRDGSHFGLEAGLTVSVVGKVVAHADRLTRVTGHL